MKPSILLLLLAVAAPSSVRADTPIDLSLAAGAMDEVCLKLAVGDTLQWRFDADAPVAFNVHHHVGKDVLMPVDVKQARAHDGKLVADRTNDWCLMWTAPQDRPARIRGRWSTRAKR